ncbi:hypothetical protein CLI64_26735 [Nostoc sp. CENA543]|nr:hypothetical protein CLI64_26735 [Nostoc sp. CENA543]
MQNRHKVKDLFNEVQLYINFIYSIYFVKLVLIANLFKGTGDWGVGTGKKRFIKTFIRKTQLLIETGSWTHKIKLYLNSWRTLAFTFAYLRV